MAEMSVPKFSFDLVVICVSNPHSRSIYLAGVKHLKHVHLGVPKMRTVQTDCSKFILQHYHMHHVMIGPCHMRNNRSLHTHNLGLCGCRF